VSRVVLDASALLALLGGERGADVVAGALPGAVISAVNLSEVVAKLTERGMPDREVRRALDGLGLDVQAFDREQAYLAGQLRTGTRSTGLSLGDRACLALGQRLKTVVLTADRQWEAVRAGVDVQVIR
jgi:PIN domain nuclease of toxin-antitoxin system